MVNKDLFTKILVIAGTILVWFTVLAPIVLAIFSLVTGHGFRFDYLMPAELFIVALIGGLSLLWAALRACSYIKWIQWTIGIIFIALVSGMVLAEVTGLAAGKPGTDGWIPVVSAFIIIYDLALVTLGIGGWKLFKGLMRK